LLTESPFLPVGRSPHTYKVTSGIQSFPSLARATTESVKD